MNESFSHLNYVLGALLLLLYAAIYYAWSKHFSDTFKLLINDIIPYFKQTMIVPNAILGLWWAEAIIYLNHDYVTVPSIVIVGWHYLVFVTLYYLNRQTPTSLYQRFFLRLIQILIFWQEVGFVLLASRYYATNIGNYHKTLSLINSIAVGVYTLYRFMSHLSFAYFLSKILDSDNALPLL